ncbi:MAG: GGDEF domain-containing protein [Endomicrobium sp.]|nr:GGDEF domain-containing protein [Endomicrobium sp.]
MKNITIDKRILKLIYILLIGVCLYFAVPSSGGAIIWISFMVLVGFYYSLYFTSSIIFSSILACCIFMFITRDFSFMSFFMCLIFISLIPFPYYVNMKLKKLKTNLITKGSALKNQYREVFIEYQQSIKTKKEYEEDMQRLSKLYALDAKLSTITSKQEYVNLILDFFSQDYGVFGGAILEKVSPGWKKLSAFGILQGNDLASFIESIKLTNNETICYAIDNKEFNKQYFSILYFPMLIESNVLGCMFIVIKKDLEARYIKDGSIFASHFALGLKRTNIFNDIRQKSRIDFLTGLLLRSYFIEKLKSEIQRNKYYEDSFYILMVDLDNFKNVNDKYGHLIGDKVLIEITKVILSCVGDDSLVGRYGGDEFIIFVPNLTEKEILLMANKINKSLKDNFFEENNEKFNVTASIGISCNSKDNLELNAIINTADVALYKAKNNGRDSAVFYKDL